MTLNQFIELYDKEGSIILLEGKRNVAEDDKIKLYELGSLLVRNTQFMTFRSGNAAGADEYFFKGAATIDTSRIENILPYIDFNKRLNKFKFVSLEDIDLSNEINIIEKSKENKKMIKLIDQYLSGNINRLTLKASFIIRDTIKVTGTENQKSNIHKATFGLFYDDLAIPKSGGTGHTMKVCEIENVPYITQTTWMNWLDNN